MKSRLKLTLFAIALVALAGSAIIFNSSSAATAGDPDYAKYVGKYPSEMFKREPGVKTRLRTLLGASYKSFTDRMQVETPIEKDGDILIMRGCMAHSCTIEEALLAIDSNDGKLYVALRFDGKFSKTFPADRSKLPAALKRAMAQ